MCPQRVALLAGLVLGAGGCTVGPLGVTGTTITEDATRQFKVGSTTYSEVVAKLGKPTSETAQSDGWRTVIYSPIEAGGQGIRPNSLRKKVFEGSLCATLI